MDNRYYIFDCYLLVISYIQLLHKISNIHWIDNTDKMLYIYLILLLVFLNDFCVANYDQYDDDNHDDFTLNMSANEMLKMAEIIGYKVPILNDSLILDTDTDLYVACQLDDHSYLDCYCWAWVTYQVLTCFEADYFPLDLSLIEMNKTYGLTFENLNWHQESLPNFTYEIWNNLKVIRIANSPNLGCEFIESVKQVNSNVKFILDFECNDTEIISTQTMFSSTTEMSTSSVTDFEMSTSHMSTSDSEISTINSVSNTDFEMSTSHISTSDFEIRVSSTDFSGTSTIDSVISTTHDSEINTTYSYNEPVNIDPLYYSLGSVGLVFGIFIFILLLRRNHLFCFKKADDYASPIFINNPVFEMDDFTESYV